MSFNTENLIFISIAGLLIISFTISYFKFKNNIAFKTLIIMLLTILLIIVLLCSTCGFVSIATIFKNPAHIIVAIPFAMIGFSIAIAAIKLMIKIYKTKLKETEDKND